jgi:hypothetical protein
MVTNELKVIIANSNKKIETHIRIQRMKKIFFNVQQLSPQLIT